MLLTLPILLAPAVVALAREVEVVVEVEGQQRLTAQPSKIPFLGFGTWNIDTSIASDAVSAALQAGYHHIDCATIYGNQKEVGNGIAHGLKKAQVKRSDIWVTSKLWNDQYTPLLPRWWKQC